MVYDPSGKSRIVIGVFPRGSPFTTTSAFAGVDRSNKLPRTAAALARAAGFAATPAADRDGVGAGGALVAGLVGISGGTAGSAGFAFAGTSTVVSDTEGFFAGAVPDEVDSRPVTKKYASAIHTTPTLIRRI